ncbi:glutamate--tRNA ligase [Mesomycoplasma lagogenitalium]|uniref:Glutamate--tRNA ligase n=1 Tax=Mesomycoplasma lagogenitalium TaxID=171286 RepID=A0ABY8LTW7_9BACT|nr:glutamate--tRNA ligase [Mesomycoplasma lagogenitalium]WGI36682.1 glutamate--tRNA ligase [Mesomycoplasma lagogenitalium]
MKKVRTRYAPSPTGFLHIGGARTALFSYLFAKHYNGDFIVRIEDTDVARNVEGGEKSQLDNLKWLGIIPDESPINPNNKYGKYRQSEKLERYLELVNKLLNENKAYKAYDTSEELLLQKKEQENRGIFSFRYDRNWLKISDEEKQRREINKQYSIRLALPENREYKWDDIVRGEISVNSNDIGDWVILKSDGYPTYNFAVVIDDYDMKISHVLRGEEHITNTPKQLAIYEAFGWEAPKFGHLTIITNMEGKKLSKRDNSVKQFIEDYKNEGYIPEAIFNFLTLLGWTSEDALEIMDHQTIIKKFDENRLSKSPSKFDIKKMEWFSKQYMKNLSNSTIISKLNSIKDEKWLNLFVDTYKQNATTFTELKENLKIYENIETQTEIKIENIDLIRIFKKHLLAHEFTIEGIQSAIDNTKVETNLSGKNLFLPIRVATTFKEHGPELAKSIYLFGKEIVEQRLNLWK